MPRTEVNVPKTPHESYNPARPASALLRSQALHLHEALKWYVAEAQAILAVNPHRLRTEEEFSHYVKKVTRILHPHSAKRERK
jgi:hypothetical protein